MKEEDGSEPESYNIDGLEPPMFDDTWGLADDFDVMIKNGKLELLCSAINKIDII